MHHTHPTTTRRVCDNTTTKYQTILCGKIVFISAIHALFTDLFIRLIRPIVELGLFLPLLRFLYPLYLLHQLISTIQKLTTMCYVPEPIAFGRIEYINSTAQHTQTQTTHKYSSKFIYLSQFIIFRAVVSLFILALLLNLIYMQHDISLK